MQKVALAFGKLRAEKMRVKLGVTCVTVGPCQYETAEARGIRLQALNTHLYH